MAKNDQSKVDAGTFAQIAIALAYVDGDLNPGEVAMTMLAMEDLGIDAADAGSSIDAAVARIEEGADVDELLAAACAAVPAKARSCVFEACAHVLMGDGSLADAELNRLVAVKALLGIDDALAMKIVASAAVAAASSDEGLSIE